VPSRISSNCTTTFRSGTEPAPSKLVLLVVDEHQLPLPGASAVLTPVPARPSTVQAVADSVGHADIALSPGQWSLAVQLPGFLPASAPLTVGIGASCRIDVLLRLDPRNTADTSVSAKGR